VERKLQRYKGLSNKSGESNAQLNPPSIKNESTNHWNDYGSVISGALQEISSMHNFHINKGLQTLTKVSQAVFENIYQNLLYFISMKKFFIIYCTNNVQPLIIYTYWITGIKSTTNGCANIPYGNYTL
jgi:hypothetical protein